MAIVFIVFVCECDGQSMSISLLNSTAQLVCYSVPPPSNPVLCALDTQTFAPPFLTRLTSNAPWTPRFRVSTSRYPQRLTFTHTNGSEVVLKTNATVIVKHDDLSYKTENNDVWATDDDSGRVWYLIAGVTSDNHSAYGRAAASAYSGVNYGPVVTSHPLTGQVWILSGTWVTPDDRDIFSDNIWTSTNMIEWSTVNVTSPVFNARYGACGGLDSKNEHIYVIAGFSVINGTGLYHHDVWLTNNIQHKFGESWMLITQTAPFSSRMNALFTASWSDYLNTDILVFASGYDNYIIHSDVWLSSNSGSTWTLATETSPLSGGANDGKLRLFGGSVILKSSSNILISASGLYDFVVSYDGAITWHNLSIQTSSTFSVRKFSLDQQDHITLYGGADCGSPWDCDNEGAIEYNSVYRSLISLSNRTEVATYLRGPLSIDSRSGLQCWPPSTSCQVNAAPTTQTVIQMHPAFGSLDTTSTSSLSTNSSALPAPAPLPAQPRHVMLSSSGSAVCLLRSDHSVLCSDMTSSAPFKTLAKVCRWKELTTYQCGTGRAGSDGLGWIGTAYGNDSATEASASGFIYVSVTAAAAEIGLFFLTEPNRYPTYYGASSLLEWNVSAPVSADKQYTDQYCISPLLPNMIEYNRTVGNKTVSAAELLHSVTLRRHIIVSPSLLQTRMQSVCGDRHVACGLLPSGRIVCWHSNSSNETAVTISPPSYLRFAQLVCGIKPSAIDSNWTGGLVTYACAITANVGLMGRLICWTVSGDDLHYLINKTHWMYQELFATVDLAIRDEMMKEWQRDNTASGYDKCMSGAEKLTESMLAPLLDRTAFERSDEFAVIRRVAHELIVVNVVCVHGSWTCTLLTSWVDQETSKPRIDDEQKNVMFHISPDWTELTAVPSLGPAMQAVGVSTPFIRTAITARVATSNGSSPYYLHVDQHLSNAVLPAVWPSLFPIGEAYLDIFNTESTLCGLINDPTRLENHGSIRCNQLTWPSATLQSLTGVQLKQVRYAVLAMADEQSQQKELCGQRLNDSRWQCAASLLPGGPNDDNVPPLVNMSAIVPLHIQQRIVYLLAGENMPFGARCGGWIYSFPRPLSFNQTNGDHRLLPANSLILMGGIPGYNDMYDKTSNAPAVNRDALVHY